MGQKTKIMPSSSCSSSSSNIHVAVLRGGDCGTDVVTSKPARRRRSARTGIMRANSRIVPRHLGAFLLLFLSAVVEPPTPLSVRAQPTQCGDGSTGYQSLSALNSQIQIDEDAVRSGNPPQMMYLYRLCPSSTFNFGPGQTLIPKLDGSVFQCGDGLSTSDCRFTGGTDQVLINKSTLPNHRLSDVRFQGVTFTDFANSAVSGNADSSTKVTLVDTRFSDFNSRYGVQQDTGVAGETPFQVNVFDSVFRNAQGGDVFSNNGGSLVVQDSNFFDSNVMAIGAVSNGGVIMIMDSEVSGGNIEDGFMAVGGSTIRANNVRISGMSDVQGDLYSAVGRGSSAIVSNGVFADNDMRPTSSTWTAVRGVTGANVVLRNSSFVDNYQMRSAVSAEGGAQATIDRVTVDTATGTLTTDNNVSSVVFANSDSTVNINNLEIDDVTSFTVSQNCATSTTGSGRAL